MAQTTKDLREYYRGMIGMLPTGTVIQVDTNEFLQILADADRTEELEADQIETRRKLEKSRTLSRELANAARRADRRSVEMEADNERLKSQQEDDTGLISDLREKEEDYERLRTENERLRAAVEAGERKAYDLAVMFSHAISGPLEEDIEVDSPV